jgi:hypothetical protein
MKPRRRPHVEKKENGHPPKATTPESIDMHYPQPSIKEILDFAGKGYCIATPNYAMENLIFDVSPL